MIDSPRRKDVNRWLLDIINLSRSDRIWGFYVSVLGRGESAINSRRCELGWWRRNIH